ncbi:hypothetical protein ACIGEO_19905 [Stenotrophomonas bentonitica]|uniref:hypothetical protein n=1 Tax=Stenotrophomonas bentonitica TaxID=1450134 RepID=UPI0037CF967C
MYTFVMDARLKKVRKERDSFRKQRDELINDMAEAKRKAKAFEEIKEIANNERLKGFALYDNDSFIDKLDFVFNEMEDNNER